MASLREALVGLEARLAHHIDFPEEDDPPVSLCRVAEEAGVVAHEMKSLLLTAPEGELLREGALTVLAGRPNVGKSSLYNALVGEERAIVTEEPGTTRDALEVVVQLGGFPFRLVDTAGLRDAGERIERIGIEVTRRYLERADLILLCVPAHEGVADAERAFVSEVDDVPVVLLETKADLSGDERESEAPRVDGLGDRVARTLRVSVVTGVGLDGLRRVLPELVYNAVVTSSPDAPVLTRRRHARGLERALREVEAFREAVTSGVPPEVAATHLRPAETALEEILGIISVEDVLDAVFSEFCVGK